MRPEELPHLELPDIPGYRTIAAIGAGSRGTIFSARELATERRVAIKVIPEDRLPGGLDAARRAIEKASAGLAGVSSRSLLKPEKILVLENPPRLALVMELVEGDALAVLLARAVRFSPTAAAKVASEAAEALYAAAEAGLVHGAFHPGKVLLSRTSVRVIGIGLGENLPADLEDPAFSGRISPHIYAADEVLDGCAPSPESDVFSLGATLHHMLTGRPPFKACNLQDLKAERAAGPPEWPEDSRRELPPQLIALVERMMSRQPQSRPTYREVLTGLRSSVRQRTSPMHVSPKHTEAPTIAPEDVPEAEPVTLEWFTPRRARMVLAGALASALVVVLLASSLRRQPSPPHVEPPPQVAEVRPTPPPATPQPRTDPDDIFRQELMSIEATLSQDPWALDELAPRLEALAKQPGEIGTRALALFASARARREELAEEALARLTDRAAAAEASGRYGDALAAIAEFPAERYAGTKAAERARLEADAIRGRAARAFAETESKVKELLAKGDYAAARAASESIRATIGISTWVERASDLLREICSREEEAAAAQAAARAAEAAKALHEEFVRTVKECAKLCANFKYTQAEKMLQELLDKPLSEPDRALLTSYAELVSREAAEFRLVASRIREGSRHGVLGFRDSPRRLIIRDLTEEGLELSGLPEGQALTMRLSWASIPEYQTFKLMLEVGVGSDTPSVTSFDERLALAVFAHHRGLEAERENELRVAEVLARTPELKAKVTRAREVFAALGATLNR